MNAPPRPVPVPDDQSAGFWDAAARHVLAVQRCEACGHQAHPPLMICVRCRDPRRAFRFEPASGRGRVKTWTVMHQAFLPGFAPDLPYAVAEVELDDADVRLIGRVVDSPPEVLAVGTAVTVGFDDRADGVAVPVFRLAAS